MRHFRTTITERPIWWLVDNRNNIDLAPPYQRRGGLWNERDRAYLIDSVLNRFDLPKFYFLDRSVYPDLWPATKLPYAVIDGRQRIESILSFVDGNVRLPAGMVLYDGEEMELSGLTFNRVGMRYPALVSRLMEFTISCVMLQTDDELMVRELFVRLNRGKPLTTAEIRDAMEGDTPHLARAIAAHPFFLRFMATRSRRGADLAVATRLLLLEASGAPLETTTGNLDAHVWSQPVELLEGAAARVRETLDLMCQVFSEHDPILRAFGRVPVYYLFVQKHSWDNRIRMHEFFRWMHQNWYTDEYAAPLRGRVADALRDLRRFARHPSAARSIERSVEILAHLYESRAWY